MAEGFEKVYIPYANWTIKEKAYVENYYKNTLSWEQAINNLYGGYPIIDLIYGISFTQNKSNDRIGAIILKTKFNDCTISNFSFNQLLVDSSYRYSNRKTTKSSGWCNLSVQQRLEICQNELSRWSIKIIDRNDAKLSNGIHSSLKCKNCDWIDYLEIINNCTTSKGFEIKIKVNNVLFHGSFVAPQLIYRKLCKLQSGAWANQGWLANDKAAGLVEPSKKRIFPENPSFGDIYYSYLEEKEEKPRSEVSIDLKRYRKLGTDEIINCSYQITSDSINYERFREIHSEYYEKPFQRKLLMSANVKNVHFIDPPEKYSDVLKKKPNFRFPNFEENGLYNVQNILYKKYDQLKELDNIFIHSITKSTVEIQLEFNQKITDYVKLSKIILGNISLNKLIQSKEALTIDRFCFNPRKTIDYYSPDWKPAWEVKGKTAKYAFILGKLKKKDENKKYVIVDNIFIQSESFGIERALLQVIGNKLYIDLISFERIIPVFQVKIDLKKYLN